MRRLWVVGMVVVAGCFETADPPAGPTVEGGVVTAAGRLYVGLLLADGETPANVVRTSCARPIVGAPVPAESIAPLVGATVRVSNVGGARTGTADADARVAVSDLAGGVHEVVIVTPDGRLTGRVSVGLYGRRTDFYAIVRADDDDADGDGDRVESVMIVDVLPDDDQDRISDSGTRATWWFTADHAIALSHLGNDFSERAVFDSAGTLIEATQFADRDGDFIGDDTDDDGDSDRLPCPGFSHDDLFSTGSEHQDFSCDTCHQLTDPVPLACHDCHSTLGRKADEVPDAVPTGHFLVRCEQCHVADRAWDDAPGPDGEKHDAFQLIGHHLRSDCFSCHEAGTKKPPKLCVDCHLQDRAPDHYPDSCDVCHVAEDWKPAIARHDDFPLAGGHEGVDCARCHMPPDYQQASTACTTCHLDDAPVRHAAAGFSADECEQCHTIDGFANHRFTHPHWPLTGEHANVQCTDCHTAEETVPYDAVDSDCGSCHTPPVFPDHSNGAVFGDCAGCHSPDGWVPASQDSFDHAVFPLEGSHSTALCSTCHENGARPRPPTDCASCHLAERPMRHDGHFEGACEGCHQATTWGQLATPYQHIATFPLAGIHAQTPCSSCHVGTTYDAPTDCIGCHLPDRPPNHYGDTCAECHATTNWNPTGSMNHHVVDPTAFPLDLSHSNLLCSQCHVSGFGPLPETCESCHLNDQPAGHATDGCASCHAASVWTQPFLPTADVIHPLAGQHVQRTCVRCHGTYVPNTGFTTPDPNSTCATCHMTPTNHFAVGATDCGNCHTVGGWLPAAGGHQGPLPSTPFPYTTWTNNRWFPTGHESANQCSDCHPNSTNYSFFSCTTACHLNRNGLNGDHNNGQDDGNDPKKQFHLFHYDATDQHTPTTEGGGPWPSAHVGCANRNCHPTGRKP